MGPLRKGANAMLNAISTRTVLGLLVLAAPVMAIIPPAIDLKLMGAEQISSFEYSVKGGDKVGLAMDAKVPAQIAAFALGLDESGEWNGTYFPLIHVEDSATGAASVELIVPEGVSGMFEVKAMALAGNEVLESATLRVQVLQAEPKK